MKIRIKVLKMKIQYLTSYSKDKKIFNHIIHDIFRTVAFSKINRVITRLIFPKFDRLQQIINQPTLMEASEPK